MSDPSVGAGFGLTLVRSSLKSAGRLVDSLTTSSRRQQPHPTGQAVLLVFVGSFVSFEAVNAFGNRGRWGLTGQRLAEAGTRRQRLTACVFGNLRLASNPDLSHRICPVLRAHDSETVTQSLREESGSGAYDARN